MAIFADELDLDADRLLVERFQAGEPGAFETLYDRYFDRLRSFCQRRVGDAHTAEELAQEAFVRALVALPRLNGDRRFYPWMTVIASRLCVDHHRRLARVQPCDEVEVGGTVDGKHEDRLLAEVDLGHLDAALQRLAPRHQQVLDLRERRGMSYHEIARHLAVTHSTVEALLHRARKALRREFAAVSGGRLAGVPVVGWFVRSIESMRARTADRLPDLAGLATPVAVGVVSAALAVVPGALGSSEPQHPAGPMPATAGAATVETATVPPAALLADLAPAARATAHGTTPTADPAGARLPMLEAAGSRVYVGAGGPGSEAEELDQRDEVGPTLVGRDTQALISDVEDGIDETLERALGPEED